MSYSEGLPKYRQFIDGLVDRREGVLPAWIRERGWPQLPENDAINSLLSELTAEQREVVALIAREARDSGIHDTLAYIQEQMDSNGLRLVVDGTELPVSPYDTEIFWDWLSRANGTPWPSGDDS